MELSILHIFIERNNNFGIIKFSIKREFHNLCIGVDVFHINTNVRETVEVFKNNLLSDPNNPKILDIIPNKHILSEVFQLPKCEELIEYIEQIPVNTISTEYQLILSDNLNCIVTTRQLKRIYNFINGFIKNFSLLDSVYKIYINMIELKENESISKEVQNIKTTKEEIVIKPIVKEVEIVPDLAPKEQSLLENIINIYTVNNIFRGYLIQHLFSHLQYININILSTEEQINITISNLFENSYIQNIDYIISILNTLVDNELENVINFNQKKIIENIINCCNKQPQDQENNLQVSILLFILYCYQYRIIALKYPEFESEQFFKKEVQQNALNYFIKVFEPSKPVNIIVNDYEFKDSDEDSIQEISNKYKHLIPVSEEEFLNLAVKDFKNKENKNNQITFSISNKKILNIETIISNNTSINKLVKIPYNLINTSQFNNITEDLLLNYNPKTITKIYGIFKQYVNDPLSIISIEEQIPKSIFNFFDYFKRNISKLFNDKEDVSTLSYYKILKENIPGSDTHSHQTFLYLIYNLIIPYYYDVYKKKEFVDVFL